MERRVLWWSFGINAAAVLALTVAAVVLARRAEFFGDLVFIAVMMYAAGGMFFANLAIAAVQAWRRREWIAHAIMAIGSVVMLGIIAFILTL